MSSICDLFRTGRNAGRFWIAVVASLLLSLGILSADMTIRFIDVGQGDASFITLPNGKTALIDGGPSNSAMSTFITAHNITAIDYVVLTHPHSDHYQGLNYVFDNCQVNSFYDTGLNNSGAAGDETIRSKAASEAGCTIVYPTTGDTLSWDPEVTIKVFHASPGSSSSSDGSTINNSSIVLKFTYNGTSALFTGDIETDVESTLVSTYGTQLGATVLKVTHHGSAYGSSSSFLNMVSPSRAYISVSDTNAYGHPDAGTITRLQSAGATVYRTDQSGTLTYTIPASAVNNDDNTDTNTNPTVKQASDYVKPASLNVGGVSAVKKKIAELREYKNATR